MCIIIYNDEKRLDILRSDKEQNSNRDNIFKFKQFVKNKTTTSDKLFTKNPARFVDELSKYVILQEAAGGIVLNANHELLMIKRFGRFDLPKGHIEGEESMEDTAIREVEEECGIKPDRIIQRLEDSYHVFQSPSGVVLKKVYWFLMYYGGSDTPMPQTEEKITDAGWYTPAEVEVKAKNTFPNLRIYLYKYLRGELFSII
ncbi:MAG: NUDIX domain-containing protein [Bacteroidota bacterium]|nr:NUDIX domain-containing protein [Bacteroidota bacterium]